MQDVLVPIAVALVGTTCALHTAAWVASWRATTTHHRTTTRPIIPQFRRFAPSGRHAAPSGDDGASVARSSSILTNDSSSMPAAIVSFVSAAGLFALGGRIIHQTWWAASIAGQRQTMRPLMAQDWNPSMGTSLSDLFGSPSPAPSDERESVSEAYYQDVPLESEAGVNYSLLKQLLKDQQWEVADNESRRLLIELAGPAAEAREYVWPNEVANIPAKDLQMLDRLWMNYSGGKFGYSVQRKLWAGVRGNWTEFFKRVNWVTGENNDYRKWPKGFLWTIDAEKGHLPLTNTLRGTGLIQAVFEHPAFGGTLKNKQVRK